MQSGKQEDESLEVTGRRETADAFRDLDPS
jgi:hypothetical protein